MKLTVKIISIIVLVIVASPIILFHGCGDNKAVPANSTITINPPAEALTNITSDSTVNYKVIVKYSDGTPIPYAIVHITGVFAEPASGAAYQFYYYQDGPGRVAGNTTVDSGFDAQTDKNGVYDFSIVVYGPGTKFTDTITITSGQAVATATLALTTS